MNKFLRPKQERVSQACLRAFFLSEKSTLLRIRGAMPWARIFFVCGRAAEGDVGQMMDWPQHVRRARGQSNTGGTTRKGARKREKRSFFFFSGERLEGVCFVLWVEVEIGAQLLRPWDIGTAAKTSRARVAARGGKTQLVAACGLRSSLSSLYTLDTYMGAQSGRNGWMSVFSSLCIYSIS